MADQATTVEEYLNQLPPDRREAVAALRETVRSNLPAGYVEILQYGGTGYAVPHSRYPHGYHCDPRQPLPYLGIVSQQNHIAVYFFGLYCSSSDLEEFVRDFQASGKKLEMGKSCVRFKRLEDVPLDVIGRAVARISVEKMIAEYERSLPESILKKRAR